MDKEQITKLFKLTSNAWRYSGQVSDEYNQIRDYCLPQASPNRHPETELIFCTVKRMKLFAEITTTYVADVLNLLELELYGKDHN